MSKPSLECDHSNESYWAVLSCGTVYYALEGSSNFKAGGWNPSVWPVKWKVLNTFICYYLLWILNTVLYKVVLKPFQYAEEILVLILFICGSLWIENLNEINFCTSVPFFSTALIVWESKNDPLALRYSTFLKKTDTTETTTEWKTNKQLKISKTG